MMLQLTIVSSCSLVIIRICCLVTSNLFIEMNE